MGFRKEGLGACPIRFCKLRLPAFQIQQCANDFQECTAFLRKGPYLLPAGWLRGGPYAFPETQWSLPRCPARGERKEGRKGGHSPVLTSVDRR